MGITLLCIAATAYDGGDEPLTQLPTTARPLRTPCIYPRSLHENRLLHHLLAKTEELILLTPVKKISNKRTVAFFMC